MQDWRNQFRIRVLRPLNYKIGRKKTDCFFHGGIIFQKLLLPQFCILCLKGEAVTGFRRGRFFPQKNGMFMFSRKFRWGIGFYFIFSLSSLPTSVMSIFLPSLTPKTPTPETQILRSLSQSKVPAVSTEKEVTLE